MSWFMFYVVACMGNVAFFVNNDSTVNLMAAIFLAFMALADLADR